MTRFDSTQRPCTGPSTKAIRPAAWRSTIASSMVAFAAQPDDRRDSLRPCWPVRSCSVNLIRSVWAPWQPYLLSVLRMVAAASYITHGTTKLLAWPASILPNGGVIPLRSMPGAGGVLEIPLGALLLVGLWTRPIAFILAGEMAVAYFTVHARRGFWPILNGGEQAVLFCFIWLFISSAGGGPLSADAFRGDKA